MILVHEDEFTVDPVDPPFETLAFHQRTKLWRTVHAKVDAQLLPASYTELAAIGSGYFVSRQKRHDIADLQYTVSFEPEGEYRSGPAYAFDILRVFRVIDFIPLDYLFFHQALAA